MQSILKFDYLGRNIFSHGEWNSYFLLYFNKVKNARVVVVPEALSEGVVVDLQLRDLEHKRQRLKAAAQTHVLRQH